MAAEAAAIRATAESGGVILFPTDTLYGLGVDPLSAAGLEALFRLKGRAEGKPVPVLLADASLVGRYAAQVPPPWRTLMARCWPGPLTLIFPARDGLPAQIGSAGKVALRVPGSALCRAVLRAAGGTLSGTSANPAGAGGTGDPSIALRKLGGGVDLLVSAGTLPPSRASTILGIDGSGRVTTLRPGALAEAAWRGVLAAGS